MMLTKDQGQLAEFFQLANMHCDVCILTQCGSTHVQLFHIMNIYWVCIWCACKVNDRNLPFYHWLNYLANNFIMVW